MKTARFSLPIAISTFLILLSLGPVYSSAANKKPVISKKELAVLLKTASEPADHQKIADYYHHEAQLLTASANEHLRLAAIYEKNPPFPAMESKHGDAFGQGASHCRKFAELQAEAAKEAEALATLHEGMAKAAEQK